MSSAEAIASRIDKDQPSIHVVRRMFGLPPDYYEKTKAMASELGIRKRDFNLYLFEGAATKLVSARETRRLYAAIGKVPTLDELTDLHGFLEENLSPALIEPVGIETFVSLIEERTVPLDKRHYPGKITKCIFRAMHSHELSKNIKEARELVVKQIGVDDPSVLEQADIWDREDYRQLRLASVLSLQNEQIVDRWLNLGNPFPPEIVLRGAAPEKVNF